MSERLVETSLQQADRFIVQSRGFWHYALLVLGGFVLLYAIAVLGFVSTTPDLRLRTVLVTAERTTVQESQPAGVEIVGTTGAVCQGVLPKTGDQLMRVADYRVGSVIDLSRALFALRSARPLGGPLSPNVDLTKVSRELGLPTIVEVLGNGRWVEIEFFSVELQQRTTSYCQVQSLPLGSLLMSLIWFLLQLAFFAIAALAYWHRPYDRSARVFFAMCSATLGAYIGGFHWWLLAASPWLVIPFAICGILVPAIPLHFFCVFPRPRRFLLQGRIPRVSLFYIVPVLAAIGCMSLVFHAAHLHDDGVAATSAELMQHLSWLRSGVYGYFGISAAYFAATLYAIYFGYRHLAVGTEKAQLLWFLAGGVGAAGFNALSIAIALTQRTEFTLGAAGLTMFLASLSFMLAYTVALVRYKLMLIEQIVSRDMLYYSATLGVSILLSMTIALSVLVPQWLNLSLTSEQALIIAVVLAFAVILLLWLRDFIQDAIDRRFFREKYKLDRAIRQINQATEQLGDPASIGSMLLKLCADGLGTQTGSFYLRSSPNQPFSLVASLGEISPVEDLRLPANEQDILKQRVTVQRNPMLLTQLSPITTDFLSAARTDVLHWLQIDDYASGMLLLGQKESQRGYSVEDFAFLNALGQIANIALHSAQLVDQSLSRLNDELQLKLEKISDQQRQIAVLQSELSRVHTVGDEANEPNVRPTFHRDSFKGNSEAVLRVLDTARKVASSNASILIRGESGTGKEVLAKLLHENSPRKDGPLIQVHCASLSPSLLESELFGHARGAFTGADKERVGRFQLANHGTLFLDEIGDISLETQIKLLRVLQERCFEPVGSTQTIQVDVRVITATHQPLEDLIQAGQFREDLFYRLNVISLTLPPLRDRRADILELAMHFLRRYAATQRRSLTQFDSAALAALEEYSWPGNVRELENVIERAVVLAEQERITLAELPSPIVEAYARRHRRATPVTSRARRIPAETSVPSVSGLLEQTASPTSTKLIEAPARRSGNKSAPRPDHQPEVQKLGSVTEPTGPPDEMKQGVTKSKTADTELENPTGQVFEGSNERDLLQRALEDANGNKAQAARVLGMARSTYYSKLKKHNII